jgi:hypothetical protein
VVLVESTILPFTVWFGFNQQSVVINFCEAFKIYFYSLPLVPIERKATLFIVILMIEASKGICNEDHLAYIYATAHRIAHELIFNGRTSYGRTSYGRTEQCWSFQAVYSRWNQCCLPTHLVHNAFRVDLDEPELSSEHHDVICRLEDKPSIIGIYCLLIKLVYYIQLSPVTVTPNCVSDR